MPERVEVTAYYIVSEALTNAAKYANATVVHVDVDAGPERVAALFPAREWLDQGALVTAGSDFPVGQFGAMRSVWGMTTRQTVIGVQGPQHAITYDEAVGLHTIHAARLLGEDHLRGTLTVGRFADLTVWDTDPAHIPSDALRDVNPTHTVIGGRLVHSPEPAEKE